MRSRYGIMEELAWDTDGFPCEQNWSDSQQKWPSGLEKFHGKDYFHPGKGHLYVVVGTVYQSEDDRWMLAYRRKTTGGLLVGPVFMHRPEDFEREGRFLEVKK